ncbi:uncharacterized protein LOC110985596 [Acanthaster planci]|uniref:Uncharacterized protein LOC110985596 n=1 Tax=Acanthaster planci TaxID=133434 RepID=A0A8B7ZC66_ACAPL|nr:uncharacterized protein LOC110985596 [Acanthaster planci]
MGGIFSKHRAKREVIHPDMATGEPISAHETHRHSHEGGGHIFLPPAGFGGDPVDFNADLNDIDGRYVFQNVTENGLAYAAGFRNGDVLFGINGTTIEGRGIEYVLDLLRTNHGYQVPQLLLAVQRNSEIAGEFPEFIWVIFKVVFQLGGPTVEVIQTLVNDTAKMPFIDVGPSFSWLGPPVDKVDIYIGGDPPLYLSVADDKMVFAKYGPSSAFYMYKYVGGKAAEGNVVAYSLQSLKPPDLQPKRNTPARSAENTVEVLDFPSWMIDSKDIKEASRLWYEKIYETGFSLESAQAEGMYLGMSETGGAMLSKEKTELKVNISSIKAPKLEQSGV